MPKGLIGWRITVGNFDSAGRLASLYSSYTHQSTPFAKVLEAREGMHVGTKRRFCLAYYSNMVECAENQQEVLLKLALRLEDFQDPDYAERWKHDAYMGSEAIVIRAEVVGVSVLKKSGKLKPLHKF